MAKGKYQKWLEPEGLLLLEGWARDGLTDEQLAQKMGIHAGLQHQTLQSIQAGTSTQRAA